MAKPRVLISGAGPAGTVLAYWLAKHDFQIMMLERSASRRSVGQIIDIEGPSQEIVQRMGLLQELKAQSTHEEGISIMNANGDSVATFPTGSIGFSNEIEILRSDLTNTFFDAAESQSNVEIRLGHTIQNLQQTPDKIIVTIENKSDRTTTNEEFDLLVTCDGMRSTTRNLVIPPEDRENSLKTLNAQIAFFSIPAKPADRPLSRVYSMPNRRAAFIKPLNEMTSSAYLTCLTNDTDEFHKARESRDVQKQKQLMADLFKGEQAWEVPRIIEEMMRSEDFYFESLAQVKLEKWSYGRCILLGDTAYAPSPLTGQGTNLAILGAYLLAHELIKTPDEPQRASEAYETAMRPYVDKVQPIPLGGYAPYLINPKTALGVWILRTIISFFAWIQIWRIFPDVKNVPFDLPDLR